MVEPFEWLAWNDHTSTAPGGSKFVWKNTWTEMALSKRIESGCAIT
jgi:hypothetical protein